MPTPSITSRETSPNISAREKAAETMTRKGNTGWPATRLETKKSENAVTLTLSKDDVHNTIDARCFLEQTLLLCPSGEPPTIMSISYCLHQVSKTAELTNHAANVVNEMVREAMNSQINKFAKGMKSLIEDAKDKIGIHAKEIRNELTPVSSLPNRFHAPENPPKERSYAQALINPPSHANPKLVAREGIHARQIVLEDIDPTSKMGLMSGMKMKGEFNKILKEHRLEGKGIRLVTLQKNKGVLVEMENNEALKWISKTENLLTFRIEIRPDVVVRPRPHTVIAFNVPLTFEPENHRHKGKLCEVNNIEQGKITTIRWAKPPIHRSPEQKTAHAFLTFTDAPTANRAIVEGLVICGWRVRVEKVKREPTRCLKCQGWNHHACNCPSPTDKCGNCAEDHQTDQCPPYHLPYCVSCDSPGHASWSRLCPTYRKKVIECNTRNPENALQFFPTTEPWMWSNSETTKKDPPPSTKCAPFDPGKG